MKTIEENWGTLSNELALPNDIFLNLLYWYNHPFRYYHNISHVNNCLNELEDVKQLAENYLELKTAIWFHDAIYNTHTNNNEEESAQLAKQILNEEGISQDFIQTTSNLILATKHKIIPKGIDSKLITDIDLAIFGAPSDKFGEYEKAIRKEYNWVAENKYNTTRIKLLKNFLEKPSIYSTQFFKDKYEIQARENLLSSLRNLE